VIYIALNKTLRNDCCQLVLRLAGRSIVGQTSAGGGHGHVVGIGTASRNGTRNDHGWVTGVEKSTAYPTPPAGDGGNPNGDGQIEFGPI
jgi:hypothetical protein